MMKSSLSIGVDLGATKIAAVLASATGEALSARQAPTAPQRGPDAVMDDIAALVNELAAEARALGDPLAGVGIGSPGMCDPAGGVVYNAVNLGWTEVHLAEKVAARLPGGWPVWVQKDANASALGEYYWGAAQGCRDFVMLMVGSGLGAGIMSGGVLVTGANCNPSEVGHLAIDPDNGRLCVCGQRGCAETVVSGPGLTALVEQMRGERCYDSPLNAGKLTPAGVLEAAARGDRLALSALDEAGCWLGIVAAACLALLNPARLIIGGGLGLAAFDYLTLPMRAEIERRVLPASYRALQILPSRLQSSALGAASMVWYALGVNAHREEVAPGID